MTEPGPGPLPGGPAPQKGSGFPRRHILFLVCFYGMAVLWGFRSALVARPSLLDFVVPSVMLVAVAGWLTADAAALKRPFPKFSLMWVYMFAFFITPWWLIKSRGWRGFGWMVLHVVAWYALATVAMHGFGLVVYQGEWLRGLGM